MEVTFVIETGERDANGDKIDLNGLKIPSDKVPILKDFDALKFVGEATVFMEGGILKATADIPKRLLGCYPAIGYTPIVRKKTNLSFEAITGTEMLNEREPKYPPTTPLGFKNVQTAFPEITLERERRKTINQQNRLVYNTFMAEANENVKREIEPFKQALIAKWPKFKAWAASNWDRTIWYKFQLTTFKYVSEELKL